MWLFTKYGFFSVVLKPNGEFQLRSRARRHLLALKTRFQLGKKFPIIETLHADYGFRLVLGQSQFANIASAMVSEIDYDNFKAEVHGNDPAYDTALMRIWGVMHQLQTIENPRQARHWGYGSPSVHQRALPAVRPTQPVEPDVWANDDFADDDDETEIIDVVDDEVPPTTYPPKPGTWIDRCATDGPFEA